jgi:hypothetical protein
VYEVDGDVLKIAFGSGKGDRPTALGPLTGSQWVTGKRLDVLK